MGNEWQAFLLGHSAAPTTVFAVMLSSGFDGTPSLSFLDASGKVVNQALVPRPSRERRERKRFHAKTQ